MADQVSFLYSTRFTPESVHSLSLPGHKSEQAQPRPQPGDRRPTPAEHAARLFAPEDVPVPPVVVRGPLISTPSEPTAASEPLPAEQTGFPAASNTLPPPSPPPEAVPPGGEVPVAVVELVLDDAERTAAERWHQDRIERKLRGEYERAGKHLAEIQTLRSLLKATRQLTETLESFDIYRGIDATLERSDSAFAEREDVDIVLRVKEAPKYFLRTATDVGDGEGTATGTAKIRNAFGGAEVIEGNVSFGTRTKSAFQLRLDTPVNSSTTTHADFSIFSAQRDLNFYASCNEATKGAMARLRTLTPIGVHEVAYEAVLREIGGIAPMASMSIREAAGPSVKSALSHTFTRDTRDDPFASTRGSFLKLKQEYAGLGGDAHFIKAEQEGSISRWLGGGYSASLTARSGFLLPLSAATAVKSLFPDRYHLGGPTSVRHFRLNSLGPKDVGDHLGGDAYYALGASLLTPFRVPALWRNGATRATEGSWWNNENLKGHVWLNAGKLIGTGQPFSSLVSTLPSTTVGLGLVYRHSLVRVEANLGVPLVQTRGEGGVKGFQFGLGLSFL
ncbi:DEAD/DEAH box helicase domain protein [Rhodotorula sp. JG-1b]|nr:DEAD/DEAH box helicase domain protein [Rhodotorula sp. JG-1b]